MDNVAAETTVNRLLEVAAGDTGGSKRVAQFLLSLWDGFRYRADLQEVMYIDSDLFRDMVALWSYLYAHNLQLESIVTKEEIAPVIRVWGDVFKIDKPMIQAMPSPVGAATERQLQFVYVDHTWCAMLGDGRRFFIVPIDVKKLDDTVADIFLGTYEWCIEREQNGKVVRLKEGVARSPKECVEAAFGKSVAHGDE